MWERAGKSSDNGYNTTVYYNITKASFVSCTLYNSDQSSDNVLTIVYIHELLSTKGK